MITITQPIYTAVLTSSNLRKKFMSPRKVRTICEKYVAGIPMKDIVKSVKRSEFYCRDALRKVSNYYKIHIEGETT